MTNVISNRKTPVKCNPSKWATDPVAQMEGHGAPINGQKYMRLPGVMTHICGDITQLITATGPTLHFSWTLKSPANSWPGEGGLDFHAIIGFLFFATHLKPYFIASRSI